MEQPSDSIDILTRGRQAQRLAGKVAIVAGGASRIGRQTAIIFAAEGACVVIADRTNVGHVETVAAPTSRQSNRQHGRHITVLASRELSVPVW